MPDNEWATISEFNEGTFTNVSISGSEASPVISLDSVRQNLGDTLSDLTPVATPTNYYWGSWLDSNQRFLYLCATAGAVGGGDHILKVDLSGVLADQSIAFVKPNDIAEAGDGYLYITQGAFDTVGSAVWKVDPSDFSIQDTLVLSSSLYVIAQGDYIYVSGQGHIDKISLDTFTVSDTWTGSTNTYGRMAIYDDILYSARFGNSSGEIVALNISDMSEAVAPTALSTTFGYSLLVDESYVYVGSGGSVGHHLARVNKSDLSLDTWLTSDLPATNHIHDLVWAGTDRALALVVNSTATGNTNTGTALINTSSMIHQGGNSVFIYFTSSPFLRGSKFASYRDSGNRFQSWFVDSDSGVVHNSLVQVEVEPSGSYVSEVREQADIYRQTDITWSQVVPSSKTAVTPFISKFALTKLRGGNIWSALGTIECVGTQIDLTNRFVYFWNETGFAPRIFKCNLDTLAYEDSTVAISVSNGRGMVLSPDGTYLIAYLGGMYHRIRTSDMVIEDSLTVSRQHIAVDSDFTYVYGTSGLGGGVAIQKVKIDDFSSTLSFSSLPMSAVISLTDYLYAISSTGKMCRISHALDDVFVDTSSGPTTNAARSKLVNGGQYLYSLSTGASTVGRWDPVLTTWTSTLSLTTCSSAYDLAVDTSTDQLVVVGITSDGYNALWVIDLDTFTEIAGSPFKFLKTAVHAFELQVNPSEDGGLSYLCSGSFGLVRTSLRRWI